MAQTCPNTWEAKDREGNTITVTCEADLGTAKKVRGKQLVRCPDCGRKISG